MVGLVVQTMTPTGDLTFVPPFVVDTLPLTCLGLAVWLLAFGLWDLLSPTRVRCGIEFSAGLILAPLAAGYVLASTSEITGPARWTQFGITSLTLLVLVAPWIESLIHRIAARPTQ